MIYKPLTALAVVLGTLRVPSAQAAQNELKEVCGWGANPTNLELHVYTPPKLAARPAIILGVRRHSHKQNNKETRSRADQVVTYSFIGAGAQDQNWLEPSTPP